MQYDSVSQRARFEQEKEIRHKTQIILLDSYINLSPENRSIWLHAHFHRFELNMKKLKKENTALQQAFDLCMLLY